VLRIGVSIWRQWRTPAGTCQQGNACRKSRIQWNTKTRHGLWNELTVHQNVSQGGTKCWNFGSWIGSTFWENSPPVHLCIRRSCWVHGCCVMRLLQQAMINHSRVIGIAYVFDARLVRVYNVSCNLIIWNILMSDENETGQQFLTSISHFTAKWHLKLL